MLSASLQPDLLKKLNPDVLWKVLVKYLAASTELLSHSGSLVPVSVLAAHHLL